jgi:hypothetical protein
MSLTDFDSSSGSGADSSDSSQGGTGQYLRKVSVIISGNPATPGGTGLGVPNAAASAGIDPDSSAGGGASTQPGGPTRVTVTGGTTAGAPAPANQPGIALSDFRIQFTVNAMDMDAPPTAIIRIFNLADSTASQISKEFQKVVLQAGYENGNFGVIFQGDIIRVRKGRLSNIDTFVDIMASNLGALKLFGTVGVTIPAGTSPSGQVTAVTNAANNSPIAKGNAGVAQQNLKVADTSDAFATTGVLPRGKVVFGPWSDHFTDVADSTGSVWSIGPDGTVNFHKLTGYNSGTAVVLNAETGMVGIPASTIQGIEVNCLLNPLIKPGTRIQLNNSDIVTQSVTNSSQGFPAYSDYQSGFTANTSTDGIYMVFVVEHEGDNRDPGAAWLTKIIALAVDSSGSSGNQAAGSGSVAAYG